MVLEDTPSETKVGLLHRRRALRGCLVGVLNRPGQPLECLSDPIGLSPVHNSPSRSSTKSYHLVVPNDVEIASCGREVCRRRVSMNSIHYIAGSPGASPVDKSQHKPEKPARCRRPESQLEG